MPPDTVVLDLRLPEPADGLSLIRTFRAASPNARIIVLVRLAPRPRNTPDPKW